MWGISIKEVSMVYAMRNLSPAATAMGFGLPEINDTTRLTIEEKVCLHEWVNMDK